MKRLGFCLAVFGMIGIGNPVLAFEKPIVDQSHAHPLLHSVAACNPNEDSPKGKAAEACRDAYLQCTGSYHANQNDCVKARAECEAKIGC